MDTTLVQALYALRAELLTLAVAGCAIVGLILAAITLLSYMGTPSGSRR